MSIKRGVPTFFGDGHCVVAGTDCFDAKCRDYVDSGGVRSRGRFDRPFEIKDAFAAFGKEFVPVD